MKVSKGLAKKEITVPVMVGVMVPVIVGAVEFYKKKYRKLLDWNLEMKSLRKTCS